MVAVKIKKTAIILVKISANTLTEDPDIRTWIFRSVLSGSGYPIITKLRIVYRPVKTVYIIT